MSDTQGYTPLSSDRRQFPKGAFIETMPVRDGDIEPATGLHWVAKLCRVMSGLLIVLTIMQVALGLTSTIEISYGVLIAEAIRLVIFAGLLWGAGDLADLFVKSHRDLRAARILLGRLTHLAEQRDRRDDIH